MSDQTTTDSTATEPTTPPTTTTPRKPTNGNGGADTDGKGRPV